MCPSLSSCPSLQHHPMGISWVLTLLLYDNGIFLLYYWPCSFRKPAFVLFFFKFPFSLFKHFTDMVFKGLHREIKSIKGISTQTLAWFGREHQIKLPFLWISDESEKEQPYRARCTMNTPLCKKGLQRAFLKYKGKKRKEMFKSSTSWHWLLFNLEICSIVMRLLLPWISTACTLYKNIIWCIFCLNLY